MMARKGRNDRLSREGTRLDYSLVVVGLSVALIAVVVGSLMLGRYPIQPQDIVSIFLSKIIPVSHSWTDQTENVLINIRVPRVCLSCLVGCCLSAAGASYQGIFQNPMASPDVLGAVAGAAFGAALAILWDQGSSVITLSSFCFSLLTVGIVWAVGTQTRGHKVLGLILAGIMVSSLFTAGTSFVKLVADPLNQLPAITYWLMGSLSGATYDEIGFVLLPVTLGLIPLFVFRWRINVLTLGDDEARTMGVNASWLRLVVIAAATLITAATVSVTGMIGWIGLVIPHLTRQLVGNNYKHLMPATMLFGAIFLVLVDDVSRNALTTEIPLGILTAFIGAPFFVYLITRKGETY